VIGGDYQGLGIARSLGRRGIPVVVLDDERSIARASRYVTASVRTPDLRDEAATVASVKALATTHGVEGWVLFPTRDETVAAIARHREELLGVFRVPTPGWDSIRQADDKRNTYRLAEELAIPTPGGCVPGSIDGLLEIRADGPWVVKPAIKEHFVYATKAKAWRADDRAGLRATFERAAGIIPADEIIVQELIPGDGRHQVSFCALCDRGRTVAEMTVRRTRQHPPEFGRASTFAETVDLPEIVAPARRFLEAMGCHGLVEVEFKHDPRDGRFKLLDVNARTWGYHGLGASAGVDFPYLLYLLETGEPVPRVRARADVAWMRALTDLPTAIGEIVAGRLTVAGYLRSLRRVRSDAVFSLVDPLPGLLELLLVPYLFAKRGV
jgi:predicted ATP-grasp superfamily ATP-dependent carboligase